MFNRSDSPNAALRPTLGAMAKHSLWTTVTVKGNYNRKGASAKSGDGLATAVANWPTPTKQDATSGPGHAAIAQGSMNLRTAVRSVATPTARDWRRGKASEATHAKNSRPLSEQIGGSLNPTWVEWLMGWPLGWTDLRLWATDKCRDVRPKRGACS